VFLGVSICILVNAEGSSPRRDLNQLHEKIHELKHDIDATQMSRHQAEESLRKTEKQIKITTQTLQSLSLKQSILQKKLINLHQNTARAESDLQANQSLIDGIISWQYQRSWVPHTQELNWWLTQTVYIPNVVGEVQVSSGRLTQHVVALTASTREEENQVAQLKRILNEEIVQKEALRLENSKREKLVLALSKKENRQRESLAGLEKDERALTQLIRELEYKLHHPTHSINPNQKMNKEVPNGDQFGDFEGQRGHLKLPMIGTIENQFGTPRADTGLIWRGIQLDGQNGEAVHAVADGRVVFADWLRGFGQLLIIDHGHGYLTLYGGAEKLMTAVGQTVQRGTVVALAGHSNGNSTSGIYFELRHDSKPLDPIGWVGH
jgi:septal ring factor EnvC (AmiA/AmiB activator)